MTFLISKRPLCVPFPFLQAKELFIKVLSKIGSMILIIEC